MRQIFGDSFNDFLRQIGSEHSAEIQEVAKRRSLDTSIDAKYLEAVEEFLAEKASLGVEDGTTWQKICAAFRQFLRNMGLNIAYSDNDIQQLFRQSLRAVQQQSPQTGNNAGARFSIIGEKGAAALDEYSYQNNLDNLQTAKQMLEAGKDAADIKLATGWEKGGDGKWRMEVPDLTVIIKRKLPDGNEYNIDNFAFQDDYLENIVNAPELFSAYGQLRRIRVRSVDLDSLGSYSKQNNTIYLNYNDFINLPTSKQELLLRSVLIHEVQHAIQHIEGFASGGTLNTAVNENQDPVLQRHIAKANELMKERESLENKLSELEKYPEENEKQISSIKHRIERIETLLDTNRLNAEMATSPQTTYKRLAGEVEARNAERRQFFTGEEKRNSLFEASEDVAEESKIYLFDNAGDSQMANIEQVNIKFNEEIDRQITGNLPNGYIHQLGTPGNILLSTGIPNLPIELSASHLTKKANQKNHPFNIADIKNLPEALQKPIAIFEYGDKSKAQNIIVEIEKDGKNFLVGLSLNSDYRGIAINDIRGLFPKETANWLNWIQEGKALYLNKEKVQKLITQQRTNLAEVSNLDLNSINNIIENFKNPSLETEKNQENLRFSIAPQVDTPEFKNWFKDSKVVDENGNPLVVYHGTNADFNIFDKGNKNGWLGKGIYFAENKKYAKTNGKSIISVYLNIQNPYIVKADSPDGFLTEVKEKYPETNFFNIAEILQKNGYDGIIYNHWDNDVGKIITVFNPTQIKSATDNVGTFDPNNPDIRFSENQRIDDQKMNAWAQMLKKVVNPTFNDFQYCEEFMLKNGINYIPARDARTLNAALVMAKDAVRERNRRFANINEQRFMRKKDQFYNILSTAYGENFTLNAGEKFDGFSVRY